ncbi:hypothetical protein MAR_006799 [Mya arenaria]|uniref:Novel STAND NTPase 3 domain-containing protein n=1 Tax=Mya arenaria TaxID=6604 RepID=A0ABY7DBP9_MYAAR|nr:hypothetical protein MAR_006799 [Mya arenaria]
MNSVVYTTAIDMHAGKPSKRMKMFSPHLDRLKRTFTKTTSKDLKEDFIPPEEVETIRQKIEENHLAIVVGYGESAYLSTVLYAIKQSEYEPKLCVLLTDPSDWNHVDPDDVQLVVFKDPFGISECDQNKGTTMFNKLDDKQNSCDDSSLDVIIASKGEILNAAMRDLGKISWQMTERERKEIRLYIQEIRFPELVNRVPKRRYHASKIRQHGRSCGIVDVDVQNIIQAELGRPSSVSIQTDPYLRRMADMELQLDKDGEGIITAMTFVEDRLLVVLDRKCRGIVYSDDKLVVSYKGDNSKNVQILDMEGNVQHVFEKDVNGENLFSWPEHVAVSPDHSTIYVSDINNNTVSALTRDGHLLGVVLNNDNLSEPDFTCIRTDPYLRRMADMELQLDKDGEGIITAMTFVEDRLLVVLDRSNDCLCSFDLSTSTQVSKYDMQPAKP